MLLFFKFNSISANKTDLIELHIFWKTKFWDALVFARLLGELMDLVF